VCVCVGERERALRSAATYYILSQQHISTTMRMKRAPRTGAGDQLGGANSSTAANDVIYPPYMLMARKSGATNVKSSGSSPPSSSLSSSSSSTGGVQLSTTSTAKSANDSFVAGGHSLKGPPSSSSPSSSRSNRSSRQASLVSPPTVVSSRSNDAACIITFEEAPSAGCSAELLPELPSYNSDMNNNNNNSTTSTPTSLPQERVLANDFSTTPTAANWNVNGKNSHDDQPLLSKLDANNHLHQQQTPPQEIETGDDLGPFSCMATVADPYLLLDADQLIEQEQQTPAQDQDQALMNADETKKTVFWKKEEKQLAILQEDEQLTGGTEDKVQIEPEQREDKSSGVSRNSILEEKQRKHVEKLFLLSREIMKKQVQQHEENKPRDSGLTKKPKRGFILTEGKGQASPSSQQHSSHADDSAAVVADRDPAKSVDLKEIRRKRLDGLAKQPDGLKSKRVAFDLGEENGKRRHHGKHASRSPTRRVDDDSEDPPTRLPKNPHGRRERDLRVATTHQKHASIKLKDRNKHVAVMTRQSDIRNKERYQDTARENAIAAPVVFSKSKTKHVLLQGALQPAAPQISKNYFSAAMSETVLILAKHIDKFLWQFDETETACCKKPTTENDPTSRSDVSDASSSSSSWHAKAMPSEPLLMMLGSMDSFLFNERDDGMSSYASFDLSENEDYTVVDEYIVESTPDDFHTKSGSMPTMSWSTTTSCSSAESHSSNLTPLTSTPQAINLEKRPVEDASSTECREDDGQEISTYIGEHAAVSLMDSSCDDPIRQNCGQDSNQTSTGWSMAADVSDQDHVVIQDGSKNIAGIGSATSSLEHEPNDPLLPDSNADKIVQMPISERVKNSHDDDANAADHDSSKAASGYPVLPAPSFADKDQEDTGSGTSVSGNVVSGSIPCLNQDHTQPQVVRQPQIKPKSSRRKAFRVRELLGFRCRSTSKSSY
jgi:hypothetical protein